MANELLPFALAMLAIVLPLLLGWVLVTLSAKRQRGEPKAPSPK
ncbi:hypothetical protein GCM10007320_52970 [Pseudorhodoferax aquiterrae]|uniref:Uncharacterized protein n=1 Tax=Pseudorhodoferax aquiterrae TaxID=747304 RepID=A0ABQ3G9P5_9BURK|nr:hypothetical protein [Pseudorhodoferax aquiterrae]GHC97803.1 hypothetical protein GCM10007320_52970 [Pseudorhodoferax aquiterrae]